MNRLEQYIFQKLIDKSIRCTIIIRMKNETEVQTRIAILEHKGWTLAAIADAIGVSHNAVEKWKAGDRHPSNPTLILLDQLSEKTDIPKKKRYVTKVVSGGED